MHDLDLPRIAIYSIWGSTQDVGWVRFAFDKFEVPLRSDLQGACQRRAISKALTTSSSCRTRAASGKRLVFDIELSRHSRSRTEERPVQEPRYVRRVGRHHGRHGHRRRRRVRQVRRRRAACSSRSARRASSRPSSDWRRRSTPRGRRRQFYAPGAIIDAEILQPEHPIFYGLRQEDDSGALRQRAAADACRPAPIRSTVAAGDAAADTAGAC